MTLQHWVQSLHESEKVLCNVGDLSFILVPHKLSRLPSSAALSASLFTSSLIFFSVLKTLVAD